MSNRITAFLQFYFVCALHITVFAQTTSSSFERSEFFINTQECVNCQLFLKNYVITFQNSQYVTLHLDSSALGHGLNYLIAKGIDPSVFDTVTYTSLNKNLGDDFDSFIVVHQANKVDTVMVKEPLVMNEQSITRDMDLTLPELSCFDFSDEALVFNSPGQFGVADEALGTSSIFIIKSNTLVCIPAPFALDSEQITAEYIKFFDQAGMNMQLTEAMMPLMQQLGLGDKTVAGIAFDESSKPLGLIKHPYAFLNQRTDTVLGFVYCIQNSLGQVLGTFDLFEHSRDAPSTQGFTPVFYFGFAFLNNTAYVPLARQTGDLRAGDCILGRYRMGEKGIFEFDGFTDFTIGYDHDNSNTTIGFSNDYAFTRLSPDIYNLRKRKQTSLNLNHSPESNFWFYSAYEIDHNTLLLLYSESGKLIASEYDMKKATNIILWEMVNDYSSVPAIQKDGVYIFTCDVTGCNYSFHNIR